MNITDPDLQLPTNARSNYSRFAPVPRCIRLYRNTSIGTQSARSVLNLAMDRSTALKPPAYWFVPRLRWINGYGSPRNLRFCGGLSICMSELKVILNKSNSVMIKLISSLQGLNKLEVQDVYSMRIIFQSSPPASHSPTSTPMLFAISPIQSPETLTHHLSPASAVVFPLLALPDPIPMRPPLSRPEAGTTNRNRRNVASSAYMASDMAAIRMGLAGGLGSIA